jgi:hypothetical protein
MSLVRGAAIAAMIGFLVAGCAQDGASPGAVSFDKAGFVTAVKEGRLWVFKTGAKELDEFTKNGELAKMVTRVGSGPNNMTIRAPDAATIDAYLAAK